jgi:hypothetical protein
VGRAFYVGEPPKEPAPCIDCLLFAWKVRAQLNLNQHVAEPECINTFRVQVGFDDYGGHCMLPTQVDRRRTGIDDHVPSYHGSMREWLPIPKEYLELYGLAPGANDRVRHFLAEANMDFQAASVEPTRALSTAS